MAKTNLSQNDVIEQRPFESRTVRFNYIKSNFFRVVHVDGAYGGLAGRGYITAAIYNERRAIPSVTESTLSPEGQFSEENILESKTDIVREVEVELIFDLVAAKQFAEWLRQKAEMMEQLLMEQKDQ